MSWHSWDIHSWSARFSLALWCLCVCDSHSYCHSYGGFGVSVAGSMALLEQTVCVQQPPKVLQPPPPPQPPPVSASSSGMSLSPPGSSLIKPEELVTQGLSLTSDVPYLEKIHRMLSLLRWPRPAHRTATAKVRDQKQSLSYLFIYEGSILLLSVLLCHVVCLWPLMEDHICASPTRRQRLPCSAGFLCLGIMMSQLLGCKEPTVVSASLIWGTN